MIIKINNQIDENRVPSKITLVRDLRDHIGLTLKDAKEIVDCLNGDQTYVIPEGFTGEEREILFSILRKYDLDPVFLSDQDIIDEDTLTKDADNVGAFVESTEIGTIVSVNMRIDKKLSKVLVNVLNDAGMQSARIEKSKVKPNESDVVLVGTTFGSGSVPLNNVLKYVEAVLDFKRAVEVEHILRTIINDLGVSSAMKKYQKDLGY